MVLKLLMPYVDRTVRGGAVRAWHKREGDRVEYGDDLFDLAAAIRGLIVVRVTASDQGYLRRICVPEGARRDENALLALLTTEPDEPLSEIERDGAGASAFRVVVNLV
jgi:pyruvate/2-oxoglutarate dehydrogenase complex dihydrolipoamide acyltransferase (E2) component